MTDYRGEGISGEYPTEQQGISNIQVNGGRRKAEANIQPTLSLTLAFTWALDIPCCSVGY
jgi:hypothetical protein